MILAGTADRGVQVREASVVAVNRKTGKVISVGNEVYKMVGRTPGHIDIIHPLSDGVISDYRMTGILIRYALEKINKNRVIRPRLIICVPSSITGLESQSIVDAAVREAGARQVFLIEEPVAAALGAGIDITKPNGNLIVDIGGGTADIAVLSLRGVVCKASIKVAGRTLDEQVVRYIRGRYNLIIGEKMAEDIKMRVGSVWPREGDGDIRIAAKGRDVVTGLPAQVEITRAELIPCLREVAEQIVGAVQSVLERTPPELASDIRTNGIFLTGGGSMISGMDRLIESSCKVTTVLADNAADCVAIGTAKSFGYLGLLYDGFLETSSHIH
jgi:rod shape-determining protein MreB